MSTSEEAIVSKRVNDSEFGKTLIKSDEQCILFEIIIFVFAVDER
jgi:hypothetical protein